MPLCNFFYPKIYRTVYRCSWSCTYWVGHTLSECLFFFGIHDCSSYTHFLSVYFFSVYERSLYTHYLSAERLQDCTFVLKILRTLGTLVPPCNFFYPKIYRTVYRCSWSCTYWVGHTLSECLFFFGIHDCSSYTHFLSVYFFSVYERSLYTHYLSAERLQDCTFVLKILRTLGTLVPLCNFFYPKIYRTVYRCSWSCTYWVGHTLSECLFFFGI